MKNKTTTEAWEKEFEKEFSGTYIAYDDPCLKQFIKRTLAKEKKTVLEELLKNGHGGGNFRRIIAMQLDKLAHSQEERGEK